MGAVREGTGSGILRLLSLLYPNSVKRLLRVHLRTPVTWLLSHHYALSGFFSIDVNLDIKWCCVLQGIAIRCLSLKLTTLPKTFACCFFQNFFFIIVFIVFTSNLPFYLVRHDSSTW